MECIIKKHKALLTNPPIQIYNRIHNRLESKIKDWYKLELTTPWMKFFGSKEKRIDQTNIRENVH